MNSAIERLLSLRVADIMNRNVVTIPASASLTDAARVLRENDITGAPVVDDQGRCVGVLSNSDIAFRESIRPASGNSAPDPNQVLVRTSPDESYQTESLIDERAESHMSPLIQTLSPQAPLLNAARALCEQHIHRLVIVGEDHRPIGIVSSLDIVAALVAAIEE
jgi:CBS domain-containing protein